MAFADDPLDELGVLLRMLAEHEERGAHALGAEDVENAGRRVDRRPVIKRQRSNLAADALAVDDTTEQRRAGTKHSPRTKREQQNRGYVDNPREPRQIRVRQHLVGDNGERSDGHSDQHSPEDRLALRHGRGPLSSRSM